MIRADSNIWTFTQVSNRVFAFCHNQYAILREELPSDFWRPGK
jgi:hypothetical protein